MNINCRSTVIAGNWKMNMLPSQVPAFARELRRAVPENRRSVTVVCPPAIDIPALAEGLGGSDIFTGAQDVSCENPGAFTGEIAAGMLVDAGVRYCIIGHSERRARWQESDELINAKLKTLLSAGIRPIVCVGESLDVRERGEELDFVGMQVKNAFFGIPREQLPLCTVAYEPIWAIGTGRVASSEQAQEVCGHIRRILGVLYTGEAAEGVSILYGGSMKAENAPELLAQPDIDGGLIGGASLKPEQFAAIVAAAEALLSHE